MLMLRMLLLVFVALLAHTTTSHALPTNRERCNKKPDSGPCFAFLRHYAYNSATRNCEQFIYGGCQGNDNNFESKEECQRKCGSSANTRIRTGKGLSQCKEGSSRPKDCNTCYCTNGQVHCTEIACNTGLSQCKEGSSWPKDCNTCYCTNGQVHCTEIACNTNPQVPSRYRVGRAIQQAQQREVGEECDAGAKWRQDCNLCICRRGLAACTKRLCRPACEATPECPSECQIINDTSTGCPTCSCNRSTFSCPLVLCPAKCTQQLDLETGCQSCKCDCNYDMFGLPPCPADCAVQMTVDTTTGCEICKCIPPIDQTEVVQPDHCPRDHTGSAPCPMDCGIIRYINEETGCEVCDCDHNDTSISWEPLPPLPPSTDNCPKDHKGRAPCPMDCAVIRSIDQKTGCEVCKCDPNNSGNPFGPPFPRQNDNCPKDHKGRAPCPMDCAVIRSIDQETGCEVCKCDPNNPGKPFGHRFQRQAHYCSKDHTGRAPCPLDCGIIRYINEKTGCEVCECNPNDTRTPWGPPPPLPPVTENCLKDHGGRAPCPMDCAVIRSIDQKTGCEVCKCDPNNSWNPFGPPFPRQNDNCPKDHNGRAPCPMDCAIISSIDQATGCEVCKCDPNNPGKPFGHRFQRQVHYCSKDHTGRAPCPMDCGIIRYIDEKTGCEVCECDPDNPGNPFF